jgi:hypothetical protein
MHLEILEQTESLTQAALHGPFSAAVVTSRNDAIVIVSDALLVVSWQ